MLGAYSQAVDPPKVTIAGIKEEDRVACVAVNGFTKYGDGPSSGCAFEEHGTLCTSCNLVSRLPAFLLISEGSSHFSTVGQEERKIWKLCAVKTCGVILNKQCSGIDGHFMITSKDSRTSYLSFETYII